MTQRQQRRERGWTEGTRVDRDKDSQCMPRHGVIASSYITSRKCDDGDELVKLH